MLELAKIKYDSMTLYEMSDLLSAHLQLKIVTNSYLKKGLHRNLWKTTLLTNLPPSRTKFGFQLYLFKTPRNVMASFYIH